MRISDWSSDVCSSDLRTNLAAVEECEGENGGSDGFTICIRQHDRGVIAAKLQRQALERGRDRSHDRAPRVGGTRYRDFGSIGWTEERKSVVEGERWKVSIDLSGRRYNEKNYIHTPQINN